MKKVLHESKYAAHQYDEETNTLYSEWFVETKDMKNEEFKEAMEVWLKVSQQVRPEKIYDYCCNFIYPITPENQIWMAHLLNPGWIEAGVKKYAHIVPEEFIANLSVDQMFEEFSLMRLDNQFEIKHFSDEEKAKSWLFEGK